MLNYDRVASGVWDFSGSRFAGGGVRFLQFETKFIDSLVGIDLVAYEEVRFARFAGAAERVYSGMIAVMQKECERRALPYLGVNVATVKKHATGKGNATKEEMREAAQKKFFPILDPTFIDDNEADALFIGHAVYFKLHNG